MNNFGLIEKYLPRAVDKYFFEDSKTAILEQGPKFVDVNFEETGYVKIASILLDGLGDYYQTQANSLDYMSPSNPRPTDPAQYAAYAGNLGTGARDGFPIGGADLKWEIFRLQYVRARQLRIDYIQNEETAGVVIGNAVEEFNRTKVIPEVDATRFSIIAAQASVSLGNLFQEDISANQIIGKFNTAIEWLTEHEVSKEDVIIYVNPAVMTLIRSTTELVKFLTQGDYRSNAGIDFTVDKYNGYPIIEVPSNRFFTNVLTTANGFRPQSSSKLINFMILSKKAVTPIRKLEVSKVFGPEQAQLVGYYGYLVNYMLYHGVVVPKNKVTGVYVSVASTGGASAKVNTLAIDTREGSVANAWKLNNYFTNPAGLRGQVVFSYSNDFTLGGAIASVGTEGTDYFNVDLGQEVVSSSNSTAYFAVVDALGTIVAVSAQVTLAKKSA